MVVRVCDVQAERRRWVSGLADFAGTWPCQCLSGEGGLCPPRFALEAGCPLSVWTSREPAGLLEDGAAPCPAGSADYTDLRAWSTLCALKLSKLFLTGATLGVAACPSSIACHSASCRAPASRWTRALRDGLAGHRIPRPSGACRPLRAVDHRFDPGARSAGITMCS